MQPDRLSATFAALSDPTRRAILARLASGQTSVLKLAEPFDISLPAVSKHLKVLERAGLIELYNACIEGIDRFRSLHLEYAATYIFRQAQTDDKNPHAVGTGGTPFMPYLTKHRDETAAHWLKAPQS